MPHPNICDIQILLHYYTTPGRYSANDQRHAASVTAVEGHAWLRDEGLLQVRAKVALGEDATYVVTEKGRCWIMGMLHLPLPVAVWTIPKKDEE